MTKERFVTTHFLPYEVVARIDRTVRAAQVKAEEDPLAAGRIAVYFYFSTNEAGEVIPTCDIVEKFGFAKRMELGRVRNGQLVMLGSDVLSDTPPSEDWGEYWKDELLGAPPRERSGSK